MARQYPTPSWNDVVLCVTLAYSALDIMSEWATFTTCAKPVHQWLLASYALLLCFRLLHGLGSFSAAGAVEGEFLVNLRLKGTVPQLMLCATWFVMMPGFCIWTVAGSFWTWTVWHSSPQCLPPQFFWFSVLWQLMSYLWIIAHLVIGCVALSREWKLRSFEADLRALEDPETLERWGPVSQMQSESAMSLSSGPRGRNGRRTRPGLSPAEITALGGLQQHSNQCEACACDECPICLAELRTGETLRRLPNCTHSFHRSCIDLWLLQSAACPLCKVAVPRCGPEPCNVRAQSFCV